MSKTLLIKSGDRVIVAAATRPTLDLRQPPAQKTSRLNAIGEWR
jgi:hypothetical protein